MIIKRNKDQKRIFTSAFLLRAQSARATLAAMHFPERHVLRMSHLRLALNVLIKKYFFILVRIQKERPFGKAQKELQGLEDLRHAHHAEGSKELAQAQHAQEGRIDGQACG